MNYPQRKYPRLKAFDYSSGGVFCVTICAKDKAKIFGGVTVAGENTFVVLSHLGQTVQNSLEQIPQAYPGVEILNYVVMPNHVHLLIQIPHDRGVSLFDIVRSTKSVVTRQWGAPVWQRSYYEHVVRGEKDAMRYWKYIDDNPKNGHWTNTMNSGGLWGGHPTDGLCSHIQPNGLI